jgi:cytochrome oxidase Cu insertion factor (SCO1/SenC/PrrC family)
MPTEIERAPSLTERRITHMPKTSPPRHTALLVLVLAIALAAIAGGWAWYLLRTGRPPASAMLGGLQVFGTLPDFTLIERDRRKVTRSDLLGTLWVANFIYTQCTDTCPLQSARMAVLQRDFVGERGLRFLSITVDPTRDTPAVLAKYAARYEADRSQWWFLTGDKQAIYALIQEGFRLSVEDPTESAAPAPVSSPRGDQTERSAGWWTLPHAKRIDRALRQLLEPGLAQAHSDSEFLAPPFLHSSWFVLGDRKARIRGYYRTEVESSMRQLPHDIRALLVEN